MSEIADQLEAVIGTTGGGYLRDEEVTTIMAAAAELRRLRRMVNIAQEKTPAEMLDAEERAGRFQEALGWYADPASYDVSGPLEGGAWGSAPRYILSDGGQKAREALGIES